MDKIRSSVNTPEAKDRNAESAASAKDFTRSEGVYASVEIYPPPPLVGGIGLIKIERVCGDCTVKELILAPSEAQSLLEQLKRLVSNDAPIPPTSDRIAEPNTPEEVTALVKRAHETISDLCHQHKRWVMSIPARPDEDPDLIISAALRAQADAIRDRERELEGHRKALSAIATAIDPVGPITPEEILAAIISDREVRRERDEFKASCVEAENAIRACPALREWGPSTAQHLASRVNNICHLYDSAVYTITQLDKERDELQRKLDELERT